MKKIFLAAFMLASLAISTVSCGGGKTEVNNDSIVSPELTDSINHALGAYYGAEQAMNLPYNINRQEFIKGVQLIAGHKYTPSEIAGMEYAFRYLYTIIRELEADGFDVNRDIILQEFRKNLQRTDITTDEYNAIFNDLNTVGARMSAIFEKREQMRAAKCEQACQQPENADAQAPVVEEVAVAAVETPQGEAVEVQTVGVEEVEVSETAENPVK